MTFIQLEGPFVALYKASSALMLRLISCAVGAKVCVGMGVGHGVGCGVGIGDGRAVGSGEGCADGRDVGCGVGSDVGKRENVGPGVGCFVRQSEAWRKST